MYRDKGKGWTGAPIVRSCNEETLHVGLEELNGARNFNLSQVKLAKLPSVKRLIGFPHAPIVPVSLTLLSSPQTLALQFIQHSLEPSSGKSFIQGPQEVDYSMTLDAK